MAGAEIPDGLLLRHARMFRKPEDSVPVPDRLSEMSEALRGPVRPECPTVLVSASRFLDHLAPHIPAGVPFGKQVLFGLSAGA